MVPFQDKAPACVQPGEPPLPSHTGNNKVLAKRKPETTSRKASGCPSQNAAKGSEPQLSWQRCPTWTLAAVSAKPTVCRSFATRGSETSVEGSEKRNKAAKVVGRTNGNTGPLNSCSSSKAGAGSAQNGYRRSFA